MTSLLATLRAAMIPPTADEDETVPVSRTAGAGDPTETAVSEEPTAAAVSTRIRSILGSAEAEGRKGLAEYLAFETGMSAAAATKILAKAPASGAADGLPDPAAYEALRSNGAAGAGLQGGRPGPSGGTRVNIVETMKRRHGI